MSAFSQDVVGATFDKEVIAASHRVPVLVDFWASWCGPCRALKPVLEKLAEEYDGRFLLAKVDSDAEQDLAVRYRVRSIPCVKAFVNGELVDEFTGALPEQAVREFIDRLLPSPADPLRAAAAEKWQAGDQEGALAALVEATRLDPRNEGARLDATEVLIALNRPEEARELLAQDYVDETDRAQSLRARLELAGTAGDEAELQARVAADPGDLAARVALARCFAQRAAHREALDQLLEVIRHDRGFQEGVGRKTMLQLFDLMAADPALDDLIREYRRALAMTLN